MTKVFLPIIYLIIFLCIFIGLPIVFYLLILGLSMWLIILQQPAASHILGFITSIIENDAFVFCYFAFIICFVIIFIFSFVRNLSDYSKRQSFRERNTNETL